MRIDGEGSDIAVQYFLPCLAAILGAVAAVESYCGEDDLRTLAAASQALQCLPCEMLRESGHRAGAASHYFQAPVERYVKP